MLDIEYITGKNHEQARERELGERWKRIYKIRRRRQRATQDGMVLCFFCAAFSLGAAVVFLTIGDTTAAGILSMISGLTAFSGVVLADTMQLCE